MNYPLIYILTLLWASAFSGDIKNLIAVVISFFIAYLLHRNPYESSKNLTILKFIGALLCITGSVTIILIPSQIDMPIDIIATLITFKTILLVVCALSYIVITNEY